MEFLEASQTYDVCPSCGEGADSWNGLGIEIGAEEMSAKWQCNCGIYFEQGYNLASCTAITKEEATDDFS